MPIDKGPPLGWGIKKSYQVCLGGGRRNFFRVARHPRKWILPLQPGGQRPHGQQIIVRPIFRIIETKAMKTVLSVSLSYLLVCRHKQKTSKGTPHTTYRCLEYAFQFGPTIHVSCPFSFSLALLQYIWAPSTYNLLLQPTHTRRIRTQAGHVIFPAAAEQAARDREETPAEERRFADDSGNSNLRNMGGIFPQVQTSRGQLNIWSDMTGICHILIWRMLCHCMPRACKDGGGPRPVSPPLLH